MLTEQDRRLLKLIAEDCRLSPAELSVQTELSSEYITKRIEDWEKEKVIVGY